MEKILRIGYAKSQSETFEFKIGPWRGGIGLMIRHSGYSEPKETGAGIWPSIEKAKEIADQIVKKLLGTNISIVWDDFD